CCPHPRDGARAVRGVGRRPAELTPSALPADLLVLGESVGHAPHRDTRLLQRDGRRRAATNPGGAGGRAAWRPAAAISAIVQRESVAPAQRVPAGAANASTYSAAMSSTCTSGQRLSP